MIGDQLQGSQRAVTDGTAFHAASNVASIDPPKHLIASEPLTESGEVEKARQLSHIISNLPTIEVGFIFVDPGIASKAKDALNGHVSKLLNWDRAMG